MSKMASRLRFALSASTKLVRRQSRLQSVKYSTLTNSRNQQKQLCNVFLPKVANFTPALTTFKVQHRNVQTEVDKKLSKFLAKELVYEEGRSKSQVQGVEGFEVTTDGADVTLTRKTADETVIVKFSVNDSVDSDESVEEEETSTDHTPMVSRPPFVVEMSKGDGRTLSLECNFNYPDEEEDEDSQDDESIEDSFEINEVCMYSGEKKESMYHTTSDVMDGDLYDLLMDMLDERGINEEFVNKMVEYSTSYEHSNYVNFLKELKTFTEK